MTLQLRKSIMRKVLTTITLASMSRLVLVLSMAVMVPAQAQDKGSFQVNLSEDGETIGDIRPVFLDLSSRPLPDISLKEVVRRYQRLFEQADEPEVRIDALHRLTNLHSVGGDGIDLSAEQEQVIYREALKSYEMIVEAGVYQGRLDELLYQTAKAYAFIGNEQQSVERLKQLVGLYPRSALVPEAHFRIAEAAFSAGEYREAEQTYQQVIAGRARPDLRDKALYMKGWSQYKQGDLEDSTETFLAVLDDYYASSGRFSVLDSGAEDLVNDTFRILALMADRSGGAPALADMLDNAGGKPYDYLLFDRLADYYLSKQRYADSVAVSNYFIDHNASHPRTPAIRAQIIAAWEAGRFTDKARQAREDYVAAYAEPDGYRPLLFDKKQTWRSLARQVADYQYATGVESGGANGQQLLASAGRYYNRLSDVIDGGRGELRRLAGDAWLQAGQNSAALQVYEKAAYNTPDYSDEAAADAAWAALEVRRQQSQASDSANSRALVTAVDRFLANFMEDERRSSLQAAMANRFFDAGETEIAMRFAEDALAEPGASIQERRSAFLVIANINFDQQQYEAAENAYAEALSLAEEEPETLSDTSPAEIRRQLATSIYRRGEAAADREAFAVAAGHFERAAGIAATPAITTNARFDAATMLLQAEAWPEAITSLEAFRADYPDNEMTRQISEKLVLAYRESGQPTMAADELLASAETSAEPWTARLQAAKLLENDGNRQRAYGIYQDYLAAAPQPDSADNHIRQQALRQKLVSAENQTYSGAREALIRNELDSPWHSEESLGWAASSALLLADREATRFERINLGLPLNRSLASKQQSLQAAVMRYQQAAELGDTTVQSRALFGRAELYRTLARDLMDSERPTDLSDLERSQYNILLEEQAYPFEDKAIALHEDNHQQVAEGVFNEWVKKSLAALAGIFPARYARESQWMGWDESREVTNASTGG